MDKCVLPLVAMDRQIQDSRLDPASARPRFPASACEPGDTPYTATMPAPPSYEAFAESLAPVGGCLNLESAQALLAMPANPRLQARVDELADKCNEGTLTPSEKSEYDALIWADHFLGLLQAKARYFVKTHAAV